MKVRSISLSFRHHPKTLVFTDAQSQMNMGQTQQTVFLVQIVCILLLYILHEITVFYCIIEPQPASLCLLSHRVSVLSGMSLREDLGGKMRVVMCTLFFFPIVNVQVFYWWHSYTLLYAVGEEIEMTPMIFNRGVADPGVWGSKFFGRIMMQVSHIGEGYSHKVWRAKVIYGLEPVFESGNTCIIKARNPIAYGGKGESCLIDRNLEIVTQVWKILSFMCVRFLPIPWDCCATNQMSRLILFCTVIF